MRRQQGRRRRTVRRAEQPVHDGLLAHLEEPLELSALFRRVRAEVLEATDGEQRPHEYASLLGEHYLSGAPPAAALGAPAGAGVDGATAAARLQQETVFWESVRESTNPADFEAYKRRFPGGVFEELADNRIAMLRAADVPGPTRPSVPDPVPAGGLPVTGGAPAPDSSLVEAALDLDLESRRRVQGGLAVAGFSPGSLDGVFGPATRAAILDWQRSRGATATGYLDAVEARDLTRLGLAAEQRAEERRLAEQRQRAAAEARRAVEEQRRGR